MKSVMSKKAGAHKEHWLAVESLEVSVLSPTKKRDGSGILYNNPLYEESTEEKEAVHVSRIRAWMEQRRGLVAVLSAIFSAIVFVAIPIVFVDSEAGLKNGDGYVPYLSALVFVGVLQFYANIVVTSKRFKRNNKQSKKLSRYRLFMLMFSVIVVSFMNLKLEPSSIDSVRTTRATAGLGNCSLLERIPKNVIQFELQEQNLKRHMLYHPVKGAEFALVYKYEEATLDAMSTFIQFIYGVEYSKDEIAVHLTETCKVAVNSFLLSSLFTPCDEFCRESVMICKHACDNFPCIEKAKGLMDNIHFNPDVIWDNYKVLISTMIIPVLQRTYGIDDKELEEQWAEQFVKVTIQRFVDGLKGMLDGTKCVMRSNTSSNSCFEFNGGTYIADREQAQFNSPKGLNCSMKNYYNEERQGTRISESVHGSLTAIPWWCFYIIVAGFYFHQLSILKVWAVHGSKFSRKSQKQNYFTLTPKQRWFLGFLSFLTFVYGLAIYTRVLIPFEKEVFRIGGGNGALYVGKVVLIKVVLSLCCVFASISGMRLSLTTILNYGDRKGTNRVSKSMFKKIFKKLQCCTLYSTFRAYTNPRNGKYFFLKVLFSEVVEMALQSLSLHQFCKQKSQTYIFTSAFLIFLNGVVTPIIFGKSLKHIGTRKTMERNQILLTVDIIIDTAFFILNCIFINERDLLSNDFYGASIGIASLAWPVWCALRRIRTLSRLVTKRYIGSESVEEEAVRKSNVRGVANPMVTSNTKAIYFTLMVVFLFTTVQFLSTVINLVVVNSFCSNSLGVELWNGASPKLTFQHGIFRPAVCAFDTITEIIAPSKGLRSVSPEIRKCTRLKTVDLRNNNIDQLPAGMIRMKNDFNEVLLDGNPVAKQLTAKNMSLAGPLPSLVVNYLCGSLEYLDLSNNEITSIPKGIASCSKLSILRVTNNKISAKGIPWQMIKLTQSLNIFEHEGNLISHKIDWSKEDGFQGDTPDNLDQAIRFLVKFFENSTKHLNVSSNGFLRSHVDTALSSFHRLESLDVSFNPIEVSILEPLQIFYGHKPKLKFLSLEGNSKIKNILLEDLVHMETLQATGTVFNLHGLGMSTLSFSENVKKSNNDSVVEYESATFPFGIMQQVKDSVKELYIRNVDFANFKLENICNFSKLTSFKMAFDFEEYAKHVPHFVFPTCLRTMDDLVLMELLGANLSMPLNMEKVFTHNIKNLALHLIGNHDTLVGQLPNFQPTNSALDRISLRQYAPEGTIQPTIYQNVSGLIFSTNKHTNVSFTFPTKWKSYDYLGISNPRDAPMQSYSEYVVGGSLGNLEIEKAAWVEKTNCIGPIFSVGDKFLCALLPPLMPALPLETDRSVLLLKFSSFWGINCTDDLKSVDLNNSLVRRLPFGIGVAVHALRCFLPRINKSSGTGFPVTCLAARAKHGPLNKTLGGWECYSAKFEKLNAVCDYDAAIGLGVGRQIGVEIFKKGV